MAEEEVRRRLLSGSVNLFRTKARKLLILAVSVVVVAILWNFVRICYWRVHPESAFKAITGRDLPPGVRAVGYAQGMTDNLFHTTHYWMLAGSPPALRQVTSGTGFEKSDDVGGMLPDLRRMFGVSTIPTHIVAGFEWELDRDRWYFILAGETNAFYAH